MRSKIELGSTPLKLDIGAFRDATAIWNRVAIQASIIPHRLTTAEILDGPMRRGDLDAYVDFLQAGYRHVEKNISERELMQILGQYLRREVDGGQGGKLGDLHTLIVDQAVACGIVEVAPAEEADADRPTTAGRDGE